MKAVRLHEPVGIDGLATNWTGRCFPELALELGADRYLTPDSDELGALAGQADLVVDTIGGEVLARSSGLLRPQKRRERRSAVRVSASGASRNFWVKGPEGRRRWRSRSPGPV